MRKELKSQPSGSQVPAYLVSEYVPPPLSPLHTVWDVVLQACGVRAAETEFASQTSISAQQEPLPPTPAFLSFFEGGQPCVLAWNYEALCLTRIKFRAKPTSP